ncbi:MAG: cation-translocating P-type ATPase [Methanobacteriaceae archaeon]
MTKIDNKVEETLNKFKTTLNGLNNNEVQNRVTQYGKNELQEEKKDGPIKLFFSQFADILIIILIIAAIAAYIVGDPIDAIVIAIVVVLNATIGFIQEYRAEKAMDVLKDMVSTEAVVRREGETIKIPASDLTIGDIVIVEEGDKIPADLVLIETSQLRIDESALTGESRPVTKLAINVKGSNNSITSTSSHNHNDNSNDECNNSNSNNLDNISLAYMDSNVSSGRGIGVVRAIGMDTSIGKIATMIQVADTKTPLQFKISKLGKILSIIASIVCVVVFILQFLKGTPLVETFMTAVSLAVAAIPEGLPAILTLTLALGMQRMAKSNAIVRKLLAVETLGSCSVICTDKTGTLTKNKMTVTDSFIVDSNNSTPSNNSKAFEICVLCNNSTEKEGQIIGDPTDGALLVYGKENKLIQSELEKEYPRILEIPLDSVRKRMSTIHKSKSNNEDYLFMKGAPELVLERCKYVEENGKIIPMNDSTKNEIVTKMQFMMDNALRVIALSYKKIEDENEINLLSDSNLANKSMEELEILESNLVFIGLTGLMDPPRQEAKDAVATCKKAGIKVVMITGDHQETAAAIAKEIGILTDGKVINGKELDSLSEDEFANIVSNVQVYARVFPEQKVRIVNALQESGAIVSMTGDGVNDAPALKKASIGVAMGSGTDVSKEASDMVLQDDNFATIVDAVKEGRTIFDNIKRFVKFQVSTNIGAIITIVSASLMSLPLPFNPVQLLWINIIMDGPPAQSLGVEGSEEGIMERKPEKGDILSRDNILKIAIAGIVMAVGTLLLYLFKLSAATGLTDPVAIKAITIEAGTVAFTVFVVYQIFNAVNCKSNSKKPNKLFYIAIALSFILQLCVIYIPFLQTVFRTTAIGLVDWVLIVIVAGVIFISEAVVTFALNRNKSMDTKSMA